jgi:hypothetical protein
MRGGGLAEVRNQIPVVRGWVPRKENLWIMTCGPDAMGQIAVYIPEKNSIMLAER